MSIIEFQELLVHIIALVYTKLNRNLYMDESDKMKRKAYNIPKSRSVDGLVGIEKNSTGFRAKQVSKHENSTPPIFYIRSKKRTPNKRSSFKKTDAQSL